MATTAITNSNVCYDNVVLANKIEDILTTQVNLSNYMTIDTSMTEQAGMKKKINVYTADGNVEDLKMGEGNTEDISVSFKTKEYEVGTTQGRFQYFDEQAMTDPMVVETGLQGLAKTMVNDFTAKAIAEMAKATKSISAPCVPDTIADALSMVAAEDELRYTLLINPSDKAQLRIAMGAELKYVEDYIRSGYIGTVYGVPVVATNAVPAGTAYLVNKEAVTLFIKKDTEVEQERDANVRNNLVYIRKVALVALTDEKKLVKITWANPGTGKVDTTGYTLLKTQPADWATNFANYYKLVNNVMTALTATETFATNTFYSKDA